MFFRRVSYQVACICGTGESPSQENELQRKPRSQIPKHKHEDWQEAEVLRWNNPPEDAKGRGRACQTPFPVCIGEKVVHDRCAGRHQTPSLPAVTTPSHHHLDVAGDVGTGPRTTTELFLVLRSQGLAVTSMLPTVTALRTHLHVCVRGGGGVLKKASSPECL